MKDSPTAKKRLSTKEQAEFFAMGFQKGRELEAKRLRKREKQVKKMAAHAASRVAYLARWREYALRRLGIGPALQREIEKEARRRP